MTGLSRSLLLPLTYGNGDTADDDVLDCSADDLMSGKVSIWRILHRVFIATSGEKLLRQSNKSPAASIRISQTRRESSSSPKLRTQTPKPINRLTSNLQKPKPSEMKNSQANIKKMDSNIDAAITSSTSKLPATELSRPMQSQARSQEIISTGVVADLEPKTSGSYYRMEAIEKERSMLVQPVWNDTCTPAVSTRGLRSDLIGMPIELRRELMQSKLLDIPNEKNLKQSHTKSFQSRSKSSTDQKSRKRITGTNLWGARRSSTPDLRNDLRSPTKKHSVKSVDSLKTANVEISNNIIRQYDSNPSPEAKTLNKEVLRKVSKIVNIISFNNAF